MHGFLIKANELLNFIIGSMAKAYIELLMMDIRDLVISLSRIKKEYCLSILLPGLLMWNLKTYYLYSKF